MNLLPPHPCFVVAEHEDIDKSAQFGLSYEGDCSLAPIRGDLPDADLCLGLSGDSVFAIGDR